MSALVVVVMMESKASVKAVGGTKRMFMVTCLASSVSSKEGLSQVEQHNGGKKGGSSNGEGPKGHHGCKVPSTLISKNINSHRMLFRLSVLRP